LDFPNRVHFDFTNRIADHFDTCIPEVIWCIQLDKGG
jgi:hypothetical protein